MPTDQRKRLIDPDEMLDELASQQRAPFQRELARWLANAPDDADIRAFAAKSPDRWSQGVAILTRAAGFTEKTEVVGDANLTAFVRRLQGLSDSDLERELARLRAAPPTTLRNGAP
jgi:hypothetical protein